MRFSVVIPLYNKEQYILKTISCVKNQRYQDFEIIIVDDGSTDRSFALAKLTEDYRTTVISQKNQGVSVARNTGITYARGEYISFLDADDFWHVDYLETVSSLIDQFAEKSDVFVTAYQVLLGNKNVKYSTQMKPEIGCLGSYWCTLTNKYDFVWTSVTTVKKNVIIDAGMFKPGELIGQDLDLWARVARINPHVAYSSHICADYNRGAENNARTRVRVAHAEAFINDLIEELNKPHSKDERHAIQYKYDLKKTVYIYTAILNGKKRLAFNEIVNWQGQRGCRNLLLRLGLTGALVTPSPIIKKVYQTRLKVF